MLQQAERRYLLRGRLFLAWGTLACPALARLAMHTLIDRAEFADQARGLGLRVTARDVTTRIRAVGESSFGGSARRMVDQYRTDVMTAADIRVTIADEILRNRVFQTVTSAVTVELSRLSGSSGLLTMKARVHICGRDRPRS